MASTSSGDMVLMCTNVPEEKQQNELYLQCKELNGNLIRDKVRSSFLPQTDMLVVGTIGKTEKFLCGLAAGIPMVDPSYIKHSAQAGKWITPVDEYDVGNPKNTLRKEMFVPSLAVRQSKKREGGVFRTWHVVVLMDDLKLQEDHRRLLEVGGARVERWTLLHLADIKTTELRRITHIVTHPDMMAHQAFQSFLHRNDVEAKIPVVAFIYVGDFLTKEDKPSEHYYDIRQQAIVDLLASPAVKSLLQARQIFPPAYLLQPVQGPSLQESPDLLDQEEAGEDSENQADLLPHEPPLLDTAGKKRHNSGPLGEPSKRAKKDKQENDSDEIQIVEELQPKNKRLRELKRKAQSFIRKAAANSAGRTQPRLDDWVVKSPRKAGQPETVESSSSDDSECQMLDSSQASLNSITRTPSQASPAPSLARAASHPKPSSSTTAPQPRRSNSSVEHFLSKTRSGSTDLRSARSLRTSDVLTASPSHPTLISRLSSQESETSIIENTPSQRNFFSHTLAVRRRAQQIGLGVGRVGRARVLSSPGKQPIQIPPAMCSILWSHLDQEIEEEEEEGEEEKDGGWLPALQLLTQLVSPRSIPPVAALHRVMMVAMRDHNEEEVRCAGQATLLHFMDCHPPGPARPELAELYLQLLSRDTPHLGLWEFDCEEPWRVVRAALETVLETAGNCTAGLADETSGHSLLLGLLTNILETDLCNWYDHSLQKDVLEVEGVSKPLLARVFFPLQPVSWSSKLQTLTGLYCQAVGRGLRECDLRNFRSLVGLAAQLVQCKERARDGVQDNRRKCELAFCVAQPLQELQLPAASLEFELSQLRPAWLPALVASHCLAWITNRNFDTEKISLRSIIKNFVNTKVEISDEKDTPNEFELSPMRTSTPVSAKPRKQPLRQLASTSPATQTGKPKPKIQVSKKNKYGETAVHTAARAANTARLAECLATPGVDINCRDNNDFTPLHEAVAKNRIESVRLLLQYRNTRTMDTFFQAAGSSPTRRKLDRVDLFAQDKDDGMSPFHEAVQEGKLEMVELMLDTVAREADRPSSGLPTLAALLDNQTRDGLTAFKLAKSDEMKKLLNRFRRQPESNKENCRVASDCLIIQDKERFAALLYIAFNKYVTSCSVAHVVGLFKETSLLTEVLKSPVGTAVKLNTEQERWGPLDLKLGLQTQMFGRRARFDIFRSESVKSTDVRDLNFLQSDSEGSPYKDIDQNHPVMPLLEMLRLS